MKEQWITPTIETLSIKMTHNIIGAGDSQDTYIAGLQQEVANGDINAMGKLSMLEILFGINDDNTVFDSAQNGGLLIQ